MLHAEEKEAEKDWSAHARDGVVMGEVPDQQSETGKVCPDDAKTNQHKKKRHFTTTVLGSRSGDIESFHGRAEPV
jgi:hypothetical protein